MKTSKPEDGQLCITVHTVNNNICDANPLDKSSGKAQINLHCLTEHGGSSGISKIRQEVPLSKFIQN